MVKEKVYVFGHQSPDTDSVTSAISVAYLKRCLGVNAEARILGEINKETKFVLNYFNVKEPKYLDNVRLQIKDVDYYKGYYINENSTIEDVYKYFNDLNITGAPIVDSNNKIKGVITSKDILSKIINSDNYIETSYDNLIKELNGKEISRVNDNIKGKVIIDSNNNTPTVSDKNIIPDVFTEENRQIHRNLAWLRRTPKHCEKYKPYVLEIRQKKKSGLSYKDVKQQYDFINVCSFNDIWHNRTFKYIQPS